MTGNQIVEKVVAQDDRIAIKKAVLVNVGTEHCRDGTGEAGVVCDFRSVARDVVHARYGVPAPFRLAET